MVTAKDSSFWASWILPELSSVLLSTAVLQDGYSRCPDNYTYDGSGDLLYSIIVAYGT